MAGLLAFNLGGPWKNEVLAPGPLAQAHGQILSGSRRCAACHPAADEPLTSWVRSTLIGNDPLAPTQTQKCLECHNKTIPSETAEFAHSVSDDRMQDITTDHLAAANQLEPRTIPTHLTSNIACSVCHKEHHGDESLTAMTTEQCQSCHQNQFRSFHDGHPDFGEWPYSTHGNAGGSEIGSNADGRHAKIRGIAFDHTLHLGKYFKQAKKDVRCSACHVENGEVVAIGSFEKTCASCHDDFLNQVDSLTFLRLPMIDPEAFATAGLTVGDWPSEAVGDFDGQLPIFVRALLLADGQAVEAMQRLGAQFDFFDTALTDEAQLEDVAQMAWSVKRLVYDLAADGQDALKRRFEAILERDLSRVELQSIAGQLSPDLFRTAQERWFPNLAEEITKRQTNGLPTDSDESELSGKESVAFGGWYMDVTECSINYKPVGHNDELTRAWIELMAELQAKVSYNHDWAAEFNSHALTKQCASCHVRQEKDMWSETPAATSRGFTRFEHRPHLVLPNLADCKSCHGLGWQTAEATSDRTEPVHYAEFTKMDKAACAKCHTAKGAGDRCTTCHNYHVGVAPDRSANAAAVSPVE